jgi:tol-pal system protein YbgF
MLKGDKVFMRQDWPVLGRWCAGVIILSMGTMLVSCVAQQADVVRIKRELDAKISQLDKSKTSLQQAVTDANTALDKANRLIARQREEIKELLQARAEVMDQMATLKDTDLSQVRGAIEQNQHLVGELDQKFVMLDTKVQTVEAKVQQSNETMEPLVKELRTQLRAEEQLRTEQGGKIGEFRTSLVDYQQVLTTLRQSVVQQEQQVAALQHHVDRLGQQHETKNQQVQTDFKDVRQHIQSVIGTLDQISTTFSARLDAYEQQRSRASHQVSTEGSLPTHASSASRLSVPARKSSQSFAPQDSRSSSDRIEQIPTQSNRSSKEVVSGSAMAYASPAQSILTPLSRAQSTSSIPKKTQDERGAYQQAFNLLRAKNYGGAAREFSGFLRTFPNSSLAANSQYWLGECYYGQRRFQEAIDEFERVFTFYPSSNKVPASLLKIGYSHLELQQPSMARSVFQQLVRTHPQSPEAIKAHGRIQEVNSRFQNPS